MSLPRFGAFNENGKREVYERQNGVCPKCKKHYKHNEMQADHVSPWSKGGKTGPANCEMLCAEDNRRESTI